jgi:hypothetical protein
MLYIFIRTKNVYIMHLSQLLYILLIVDLIEPSYVIWKQNLDIVVAALRNTYVLLKLCLDILVLEASQRD